MLKRYLTMALLPLALNTIATDTVMAKPKPPATPKEEYIKFERQEPSAAQQQLILEAGLKLGVRPGIAGVLMGHESAGTWHPQIRPSHPDKPSVKVTLDGQVRGVPGSSAVGLGQYIDPTWVFEMYRNGESIIREAELDKHNPAAVATIRAVNKLMQAELDQSKRKPDWTTFAALEDKHAKNPAVVELLKLRSDPTHRIPIYTVMHSIQNYSMELQNAGYDVNATNIYIIHHTSLSQLAQVRRKDYVAADDPKMAGAVAVNGAVFMNKDGTAKTSTETYAFYGSVMSDDHASRFEREHYGRDFGKAVDAGKPRVVKGTDGQPYRVRNDLLVPRLPDVQFLAAWKQPPASAESAENLAATVTGLERLGYDFGKTKPADFTNSRLRAAITSFKHQAGLPHADSGQFDATTQRYLQQSVANVDKYTGLQQAQKAALQKPGTINLATLGKDLRNIAKDDPIHAQLSGFVIDLKKKLEGEGLLKPPSRFDRVKGADGKTRRVEVKLPFDGKVDNRMLAALSSYQRNNGLMDTKGIYEEVTLRQLNQKKAPAAAPVPVQPAVPAAPKANPRMSSGVVTGQAAPAVPQAVAVKVDSSPTAQFAAVSSSLSGMAVRRVNLTNSGQHIGPSVASYGNSLVQGNKTFDERVYQAQRLIERVGLGHLLGKSGADGLYGDSTDAAFSAYAATKNESKKPGQVSETLLSAMRDDRLALATKGRSPDFFERYLAGFSTGGIAPAAGEARANYFSSVYPNVISSQLHDASARWGKTAFGITSDEADYKAAAAVLIERGHLKQQDLTAPNAHERTQLALREYQSDIGLMPTGRLDRATKLSVEQTALDSYRQALGVAAGFETTASGRFNWLGTAVPDSISMAGLGNLLNNPGQGAPAQNELERVASRTVRTPRPDNT